MLWFAAAARSKPQYQKALRKCKSGSLCFPSHMQIDGFSNESRGGSRIEACIALSHHHTATAFHDCKQAKNAPWLWRKKCDAMDTSGVTIAHSCVTIGHSCVTDPHPHPLFLHIPPPTVIHHHPLPSFLPHWGDIHDFPLFQRKFHLKWALCRGNFP